MRDSLQELARFYGVQTAYEDVTHRFRRARPEAVLAVLKALGAPVTTPADCPEAVRWRRQMLWQTVVPPVTVVWEGATSLATVELRMPSSKTAPPAGAAGPFRCRLEVEGGEPLEWTISGSSEDSTTYRERTVEGVRYAARRIALPGGLPAGYHRFTIDLEDRSASSLVLVAPVKAWGDEGSAKRMWGIFMPLYALHRQSSWGAGDLGDLEAMAHWVGCQGGSAVQVLPLLATLWELGDWPSPYEPATRLFWNEFYLDVTRIPHLPACAQAKSLLEQARQAGQLEVLRKQPLVDYAGQMDVKREIVEALAAWYFSGSDQGGMEEYCRRQPQAETFARFRAAGERQRMHWPRWPDRLRQARTIQPQDYDLQAFHYYLYSQWQMEEQLQAVADRAGKEGVRVGLDLPLGVRRDGFDAWLKPDQFVPDVTVGAPPDTFFAAGQNWGFSPLHPARLREAGYDYFVASLRRQLHCAGILRLDHVMGLHRLFWIPDGMAASEGVYVHYPREELFAVLAIESQRAHAIIAGENLGTVPEIVNASLHQHGILSMYVVPFEISPNDPARSAVPLRWHRWAEPEEAPPLRPVPGDCLASMNTHDLPTFAAFWAGLDIEDRLERGLLDARAGRRERAGRRAVRLALLAHLRDQGFPVDENSPAEEVLEACLVMLADSPARIVLVNIEDLWGETQPQNVPGAGAGGAEHREPLNWRRKAKYRLEEFAELPEVTRILGLIDHGRRQPRLPRLPGRGLLRRTLDRSTVSPGRAR